MKELFAIIAVVLGLVSHADVKPMASSDKKNQDDSMEMFMKTTGGVLHDKRTGTGNVAVIDAQKDVPAEDLEKHVAKLDRTIGIKMVRIKEDSLVDLRDIEKTVKRGKGTLSVVLANFDSVPSALISFPEMKCALVNVAALKRDKPGAEKLKQRVLKEISRAVCFAFVIPYCNVSGGVMDPVFSVEDLDKILVDNLQVAQQPHIEKSGSFHFGIKPYALATYRDACQQGWAPRPVNKYQKAIWDEVHEMPTAPIKIEK